MWNKDENRECESDFLSLWTCLVHKLLICISRDYCSYPFPTHMGHTYPFPSLPHPPSLHRNTHMCMHTHMQTHMDNLFDANDTQTDLLFMTLLTADKIRWLTLPASASAFCASLPDLLLQQKCWHAFILYATVQQRYNSRSNASRHITRCLHPLVSLIGMGKFLCHLPVSQLEEQASWSWFHHLKCNCNCNLCEQAGWLAKNATDLFVAWGFNV